MSEEEEELEEGNPLNEGDGLPMGLRKECWWASWWPIDERLWL